MVIVVISCLTFNASPEEFLGRIEIVIGMFLTSFAIQWTVMERLPPTPYLNNIDYSLISALLVMGLGNENLAMLLDTEFRIQRFHLYCNSICLYITHYPTGHTQGKNLYLETTKDTPLGKNN